MKHKSRLLVFFLVSLVSWLAAPLPAAEKEGQWLRVPNRWLLHRFVRPATAPANTYRVALAFPAGATQAKVAQSSGHSDVDRVAGDYAQDTIRNNKSLREIGNTKELYFQLIITPPALDIKMRSKKGRLPVPAGKELYAPISETFFTSPNQNELTARAGELVVIFPPGGGYASEAIVTVTTGNSAVDRYYLHVAALNWQTTRKSSEKQVLRSPFSVRRPTRYESILPP